MCKWICYAATTEFVIAEIDKWTQVVHFSGAKPE